MLHIILGIECIICVITLIITILFALRREADLIDCVALFMVIFITINIITILSIIGIKLIIFGFTKYKIS